MIEPIGPEGYAKRLVKGSAVIFAALLLSGLVGFLLRMFLARSLGVAEYGLFYAVFAFIGLFGLCREFGLNSTLVKYIPEFSVRKRLGAIKSSVAIVTLFQAISSFSIAAVFFVFSGQIASTVFGTEAAIVPIKILSMWFFATAFYRPLIFAFRGFQNFSAYALMEFFWIAFILLTAFLFVGVLGKGIGGIASAYLVATLAMTVLGAVYFRRKYPRVLKKKMTITKPLAKKLFRFALPVFFYGLGGLVIGYMDILMITAFRTVSEVGIYQAAQPTAYLLWYFVGAVVIVLFPIVSELWARRKRKLLGGMLHFLIKFSFVFVIPAALILIAFPEIVIRLLFGADYLAGAAVLQILSGVAIIYTLYKILVVTISGVGKPIVVAKVFAVMACLNLVGNLLLIPTYGIEGAAVTTLCAYLFGLGLLFYHARKFIKFAIPAMPLLKTSIGGALTLFLIFGLKFIIALSPWIEAFVVLIPSLLFYGAWLLTTKTITKNDLRIINRVVPMPRWLVRLAGRFTGGGFV